MSYWYNLSDPEADIAVSTRIRLARNLNGMPFPSKMTDAQFEVVNESVRKAVFESNTPYAKSLKFIYMKDIPENERFSMVERHIISQRFASNCENRAIIISEDESVCIMLGEEDHIRIQVILSGLQLEKAYDIAENIDSLLCGILDLAFDDKLGFLTECPTNLGTGLRASVMLHLPVIENSGETVAMDKETDKYFNALHECLFESVYRNPKAKSEESKVFGFVKGLYDYYCQNSELLPEEYRNIAKFEGVERAVVDYIAGMTDHFAVVTYTHIYIPGSWEH